MPYLVLSISFPLPTSITLGVASLQDGLQWPLHPDIQGFWRVLPECTKVGPWGQKNTAEEITCHLKIRLF